MYLRNVLYVVCFALLLLSDSTALSANSNNHLSELEAKQKIDELIGGDDAKLRHDRKARTEEAIKLLPLISDEHYQLDVLYAHFAAVCMSDEGYSEEQVTQLFNQTTSLANKLGVETKLYYSFHYLIYYYEKKYKYKKSYQLIDDMYKFAVDNDSIFGLVHSKLVDVNTARVLRRHDKILALGNEILEDTKKLFALDYGKSVTGVEKQITSYIANALFDLKRSSEAITIYQSLINKYPENLNIRYTFVDMLFSANEWEKAEAILNDILKSNSPKLALEVNRANISRLKGEVYFHKQDFEQAIPLLESFTNSKNVGGFRNAITTSELLLAKAYWEIGKYEQSANYFKTWSSKAQEERSQQLKQNVAYLSVELDTQQSQFLRKQAEQKLQNEQAKTKWQLIAFVCSISLLSFIVWGVIKTNRKLSAVANMDPLTKLPNRRFAFNYIDQLIENTKPENKHCIAIIDIDDFKTVNDSFGHDIGDKVLSLVAQTCRRFVSPTDIVARLGGEEFVVVFPNTNIEHALAKLENVRTKISSLHFDESLLERKITISAGISALSNSRETIDWLKKADIALYEAKHKGKNRTEIYKIKYIR